MEFRKYDEEDATEILSWIKNEREFRLWSAYRYKDYPIKPEDMNENYRKSAENANFFPMVLTENDKVVGHIIIRNPGEDKQIIRFGFIIVNSEIRRKGYGRKLILKAIEYAKGVLNAKEINLGVFTTNIAAIECYKSLGFEITSTTKDFMKFQEETWDCFEMKLKEI